MASSTTAAEAASRSALLDVRSYQIFLDLTASPTAVRSRTRIQFGCRQQGATTFADLEAVRVTQVRLNDVAVRSDAIGPAGRLRLDELAASNILVVDATIAAVGDGRGLAYYTDAADGGQYVLITCYPTAAGRVFCCFDQPDLRAEVTLEVAVPAGWECAANGAVVERPEPGEAGVWRFAAVPAMKPYDFMFCAGPYVSCPVAAPAPAASSSGLVPAASTTRLTVRSRGSLAGSPGLSRIAGIVEASLRFYEQLLGVPCPYGKLDIVYAPELGPTAIQVPAIMVISENLLQRAADAGDEFVAISLAHEAAHLWFDGLVGSRWWDDLWLGEALATYLSYAAAEAVLGQPDAWARFGMTEQEAAYRADSLPSTQPVSSPVSTSAAALSRPSPITYAKGTSVIRQLAALIGAEAMRAGLQEYLTRYAWSDATLADLIGCWSQASGRELTTWASQWLQQPGVNTLRPQAQLAGDDTIRSLEVVQEAPSWPQLTGFPQLPDGPLRPHQLTVGCYEPDGPRLKRTGSYAAHLVGGSTTLPLPEGAARPAAFILNDTDLTFAKVRFDSTSFAALAAVAMDVGDPLAESVCWNAAWDMVQAAELAAAEFAGLVTRRMSLGGPAVGSAELLDRAVTAALQFADPSQRAALLEALAAAALTAAASAESGRRHQQTMLAGFATCATSADQLDLLRSWLDGSGRELPDGIEVDLDTRARMLANLAAHDRVTDDDLAGYAAADPVLGDMVTASCAARRPTMAAKRAAWQAALTIDRPKLARAHAQGFWVPGQEQLTAGYLERYFGQALPAISRRDARSAQRLARALYPLTLADDATLAATDAQLASTDDADPVRAILLEQRATVSQMMAARRVAARAAAGRAPGAPGEEGP